VSKCVSATLLRSVRVSSANYVTRYWSARRASARLVEPSDRVRFGMRVMLRLPSALLGREIGDGVSFQGGEAEVLSIEP
jgi:hypothetical protein